MSVDSPARLTPSHFAAASGVTAAMGSADMDVFTFIQMILMDRAGLYENQIKDQMGEMQKRNEWLKDANAALSAMRTARPTNTDDTAEYPSFTTQDGREVRVQDWCAENGVPFETTGGDNIGLQTEFDQGIQNIKSAVDAANNQSQLDMTRLQGLNDKLQNVMTMISNILQKSGKLMEAITGNMR